MAVGNARLKTSEHLEKQIAKLNRIGIALSSEHDLNKLLELIVKEARGFTNADGGSLYIIEGGRLNFVVAQTASLEGRGGTAEPFKSVYLPLTTESIAGYVAVTGDPLNIADVYRIPPTVAYRFNKQFDMKTGYRSKSMLVVPMRDHEDAIIGVLQLINSLDGEGRVVPFEEAHQELILSLASQAAVAIRNAKLIQEIKNVFRSLVRYSAKAIDARSPHTAGHSGRVAMYCVRMAHAINEETGGRLGPIHFSPEEIEELRMAGWLHDIGKIGVREAVLEKTTKLNAAQMQVITERFEAIRQSKEKALLQAQLRRATNGHDLEAPAAQQAQLQRELAELDDDLAFLQRCNVPGYLDEADQVRLRAIAERTYTTAAGEVRYYLTPEEYESLAIVRGNLTPSEYTEIQSHVAHTLSILDKIPFTRDLANIPKYAAAHHEYLDGSGYPRGLKGDEISIQSRIMCIADIFDALSAPDRPYKKALPLERALEILRQEVKAGKLDGDLVELFIRKQLYHRPAVEEEDE